MRGFFSPRRGLLAAVLAVGTLAVAAAAQAGRAAVSIDNFSFTPATLTVKAGTRVVWKNADDMVHSVVSAASPPLFRSKALDTDDSFSEVFDKPGTYRYFCGLHPFMQGTIVVQ